MLVYWDSDDSLAFLDLDLPCHALAVSLRMIHKEIIQALMKRLESGV